MAARAIVQSCRSGPRHDGAAGLRGIWVDFALVGLGVGALAVLIGLGARVAAPVLWPIRHDRPLAPRALMDRVALIRFALAGGLVLALAGTAVLVMTMIAIVLGLSDRAGAIVVMATITAGVLASTGWGVLYTRRYHPRPLPPSPLRRAPGASHAPARRPGRRRAHPAETDGVDDDTGPPPDEDARLLPDDASRTPATAGPVTTAPVTGEADAPDGEQSGAEQDERAPWDALRSIPAAASSGGAAATVADSATALPDTAIADAGTPRVTGPAGMRRSD